MHLTSQESKVYEWIKETLKLPVYGDVFYGAAKLMAKRPIGYINFVSHAGRDIMNGLSFAYLERKRPQVQYKQLIDNLKPHWTPIEIEQLENAPITSRLFSINENTYNHIEHLLREHEDGRQRSDISYGLFFQTFLKISPEEAKKLHLFEKWNISKNGFQKMTHLRRNAYNKDAPAQLEQCFKYLVMILDQAASNYYEQTCSLNDILEETNNPTN
jgi:hypothetical protein